MATFIINSFDQNDEPCTVTVECSTYAQASLLATNARIVLRQEGIIKGGSDIEEVPTNVILLFNHNKRAL